MKTFVIGDIHGAHKALMQCLERSGFDPKQDELISLGDICDGWPETFQCVEEILKLKHLFILGNHDQWFIDWFHGHHPGKIWTQQGGAATAASYGCLENIPRSHKDFFENALLWFLDEKNRLFVHGGINPRISIEDHSIDVFLWDRSLVQKAIIDTRMKVPKAKMTEYENVFIGHTSTTHLTGRQVPENFFEIWALDTGAGWEGKLTIMDVDSKEFWQSDTVADLYPNEKGRR